MIINLIVGIVCVIVAIILFRNYNSGKGGPIGSLKKRLLFLFSIITILASIFFFNKAYFYKKNKNNELVLNEIKSELYELEDLVTIDSSNLVIEDMQSKLRIIMEQINSDTTAKNETIKKIVELKNDYFKFEGKYSKREDSIKLVIREKQIKIASLMEQLNLKEHKEYETYYYIILSIVSALILYLIFFIVKNGIFR